jgi:hypothetical protein
VDISTWIELNGDSEAYVYVEFSDSGRHPICDLDDEDSDIEVDSEFE